MTCAVCDGRCSGADLRALTAPELTWLWEAVASAADRRGDPDLVTGPTVTVTVPTEPARRAAAAGLLGARPLVAGQRRRVDLPQLTAVLAAQAPNLTPGAVAAHAMGRRLAVAAAERANRAATEAELRDRLTAAVEKLPSHVRDMVGGEAAPDRLRASGWIARLLAAPDPGALLDQALAVLSDLPEPGARRDRRTLVPGDPHALDEGTLPGLVLALANANTTRGARAAWDALGVDCDDLLGGLIVTGIAPAGWHIPAGATVTIPPRELSQITWQAPPAHDRWVFVTENPSVLTAALALTDTGGPVRVICYAGTPSATECEAIAALSDAGWAVAVRADFDTYGLAHVRALCAAAPTATPWRMSSADYLSAAGDGAPASTIRSTDTPWDPALAVAMNEHGPVYEEQLLPALLADVASGHPEQHRRAS